MIKKRDVVCEYDGYVLPPAPEFVTPEMERRKKELEAELDKFFAKKNSEKSTKEHK